MRVVVDLSEAGWDGLHAVAADERRNPRDQAAVLLEVMLGLRPHASANGQDPCPLCGSYRRPGADPASEEPDRG